MSDSRYILIYPFGTREQAFEVANNIDGSLMWSNGAAYPKDNIPAFIVPLSEFSERWVAPNEIQQLTDEVNRVCEWKLEDNGDYIIYNTSCGEDFILEEGTPKENLYNYCPSCGGKLREALAKQGDSDE